MTTEDDHGKTEEGMKTEVVAKAKRLQRPAEYKLRILREVEGCQGKSDVVAGLYSSSLPDKISG